MTGYYLNRATLHAHLLIAFSRLVSIAFIRPLVRLKALPSFHSCRIGHRIAWFRQETLDSRLRGRHNSLEFMLPTIFRHKSRVLMLSQANLQRTPPFLPF